jgi:hypothetical protein
MAFYEYGMKGQLIYSSTEGSTLEGPHPSESFLASIVNWLCAIQKTQKELEAKELQKYVDDLQTQHKLRLRELEEKNEKISISSQGPNNTKKRVGKWKRRPLLCRPGYLLF